VDAHIHCCDDRTDQADQNQKHRQHQAAFGERNKSYGQQQSRHVCHTKQKTKTRLNADTKKAVAPSGLVFPTELALRGTTSPTKA